MEVLTYCAIFISLLFYVWVASTGMRTSEKERDDLFKKIATEYGLQFEKNKSEYVRGWFGMARHQFGLIRTLTGTIRGVSIKIEDIQEGNQVDDAATSFSQEKTKLYKNGTQIERPEHEPFKLYKSEGAIRDFINSI